MLADRNGILAALNESVIVAITDSSGTIIEANDRFCEISGYQRHELIGQDHRMLNSGHHPRTFWSEMYRTVASGRVWRAEVQNRAKDGRHYWVDTTISGIRDDTGRLCRMVAIRVDISERKLAQEQVLSQTEALLATTQQLRESMEALAATTRAAETARRSAEDAAAARGNFLAMMSHEIRTPMTAILGYAEVLGEASQPAETQAEAAEIIRRNGRHLLKIINDILDLTRIEAGRMPIEAVACSPAGIIEEVVQLMRARAEAKGLTIEAQLAQDMPSVMSLDPTRVRQILLNLVGNAVKFTEYGTVSVHGECATGDELVITVSDTGEGIAPDELNTVFSPFIQADASTSRRHGGTGLGLTISQRLAELMGGSIEVASRVGVGSAFSLRLPARVSIEAATSSCGAAPASMGGAVGPLCGRILLAEDAPDSQRLLSFHLTRAGAKVTVADNGQEAFAAATEASASGRGFDVVLMDMQMPILDGYEATRRLRQSGYVGPIVAITAHSMSGEREKCLLAGCDDYASKPIDRDMLVELCRRWMSPIPRSRAA